MKEISITEIEKENSSYIPEGIEEDVLTAEEKKSLQKNEE